MNKMIMLLLGAAVSITACRQNTAPATAQWEAEIRKAEADFARMAEKDGIAAAFTYYADSNAVIKRGKDSLIHGRDGIHHFYTSLQLSRVKLSWTPDFVAVSGNGDLGYTYGKYQWADTDSTGKINQSTGLFHTIWKRQPDGSWRYVWD